MQICIWIYDLDVGVDADVDADADAGVTGAGATSADAGTGVTGAFLTGPSAVSAGMTCAEVTEAGAEAAGEWNLYTCLASPCLLVNPDAQCLHQ